MRTRLILGFAAGVALAIALFRAFGTSSIGHAFRALGWTGFAAIIAFHLGLILLMGFAWSLLLRDVGPLRFIWARLVRDSASQALPLSQLGGMVLGVRALTTAGVPAASATASLIVDMGIEMAGLVCYALIGLLLLCLLHPSSGLVGPVAAGLAAMTGLAAAFIALQIRGSGAIGRWLGQLAARWSGRRSGYAFALPTAIRQIHTRYERLAAGWLVHLVCWVLTAVQMWLTLRLMDVPIRFGGAVIMDSLAFGIRSIAFMVPGGIGVQEGAFVLLGGIVGIGGQTALALSLIRRGRDVVIAVPALIGWQVQEGRLWWRRTREQPGAAPPVRRPEAHEDAA